MHTESIERDTPGQYSGSKARPVREGLRHGVAPFSAGRVGAC